jgi:hypothetical protein
MKRRSDYAELVAKAERAVASVSDPELKRAAFEKILEDLLAKPDKEDAPPKPKGISSGRSSPISRSKKTSKKKGGPQAYVEELAGEGFFKKPKTIAQVKAELENRGHHIPLTSLSGPLQKLCQRRTLRRQKSKKKGNKHTFNYSNW